MATQQHLYRRGPIYWWRHALTLFPGPSYDARISLRTASKNEARQRAGYLTAMTGSSAMTTMLEDYAKPLAVDRRITATQLNKIYKEGLDEALARFIGQQDSLPGRGALNRQLNEASADYYQWLIDTDGRTTIVSDEYAAGLEARDFDPERIERLKLAAATRAGLQSAIKPRTVEFALIDAGIPVNDTTYAIAKRQLWLAYRDAARDAEPARLHRAGERPASITSAQVLASVPDSIPSMTIIAAMESCLDDARPKDGTAWPSEVQVRTSIALLVHVTGETLLVRDLTQKHIGDCAKLMKALPNRWGRTREELDGGISASLERAATLPPGARGLGAATVKKHFTWMKKVIDHATRHDGAPLAKLNFSGFQKDRREAKCRKRDLRAIWSKEEISKLFTAPIFTGCHGILDTQRLHAGDHVYHDGWYFGPLMFTHLGGRSAEVVGMPMCDVHEDAPIPYVEIAVHQDRRLKNEQSTRKIPIHSELIRLGFIGYVRANRFAGETMLFPEMVSPDSKSFASTFYKKVFSPLRKWAFPNGTTWRHVDGGAVKDKDVYSFRGRTASEMRSAGVPDGVIADVLGHEQKTTAGQHYLEVTPLDVMLKAMKHTEHLTEDVVASPLNMRPPHLRRFGSTAAKGGRPKKETV